MLICVRTHVVLKVLQSKKLLKGKEVDFLYVDEAQDNLLIDALLLRLICRNPEGLVWAGDTAQTISAGSSFRFDDLKAFMYRIEENQAPYFTGGRAISQPSSFQLTVNYRSHGGIVNCADSVIELICRFWPNSIDILQRECGIVQGPKPVFFTGWGMDSIRKLLIGTSDTPIPMGVLVRNDEAREELRRQVGNILIMTLQECKGLEFHDVFLYNFFEDSKMNPARWRLVLAAVDGAADGNGISRVKAPCFERDAARYAGICSELKLLYVGITRAQKKLWIVDKSEQSEPMRLFWTTRSLVQGHTPNTNVPSFANPAFKDDEWAETGHYMFRHKRYPQAMHCFAQAKMQREVKIAEAHHFRDFAWATIGTTLPSQQQKAFSEAADAFVQCAGEARGKEKLQYYYNAAECYVRAAENCKAADAYVCAEEYEEAAKHYRKAGIFDKTVDIIQAHADKMSRECADDLLAVCRLYYCSKDDVKPPSSLFSSFEEELEFLETYELDVAQGVLLESHGKFVEAAELHLNENRPIEAIKLLLRVKSDARAIQRNFVDDTPRELLMLSHLLPMDSLSPKIHDEITMFQAAEVSDMGTLERLAASFLGQGNHYAQAHVPISSLDAAQYNARVGIHLQQMRILQLVYSAFPDMRGWSSVEEGISNWVQHLYEAFFPPFHAQGSIADIAWSSIPEASDVAYNCPPDWFGVKAKISRILSGLRSNDPNWMTPGIYRRYTEVTLDDYLQVVLSYDEIYCTRDLVHLIHKQQKHRATGLTTFIKQLEYDRPEDIPVLLDSHLAAAHSLRVEEPTLVPRKEDAQKHIQLDPKIFHLQNQHQELDDNIPDTGQCIVSVDPTSEETSAACTIQGAYRRYHRESIRRTKRSTLEAERSAIFEECLKHCQGSNFKPGLYRLLYLGPLVHLLWALNKGIAIVDNMKAQTKIPRLLISEGHERLEEIGRRRTELS
ncbi:hypothetical protein ID866_8749 [Astraeus odoratus]|nr:hypothetical protein ID866_8749 [Astraeus odoratus]